MNVIETKLEGVRLIEPKVFGDERGFFLETWNARRYEEAGLPGCFVQDNLSFSRRGVLRGLHFQHPDAQGKLVYVLQGEVFDVAVDVRVGSPSFGEWVSATLSAENRRQIYIPEGFAHGFLVLSESALFVYKCTASYNASTESIISWNDPEIGIKWPVESPTLSEKDRNALTFKRVPRERLPRYGR